MNEQVQVLEEDIEDLKKVIEHDEWSLRNSQEFLDKDKASLIALEEELSRLKEIQ